MLETTPHPYKETTRTLPATSPEIHHLTRLKYVGDSDYHFPFLDLSYAQALTHNGELVGVDMPPEFFQIRKRTKKQDLYRACVAAGIHGKKLGVYDAFTYN